MHDKETIRFQMVKKRHFETFFEALSKKKVDPQAVGLCRFISGTKNFFSSSVCSGRIVLLKVDKNESKKEAAFHAKWHRKTRFSELWKELERETGNEEIWFKMEPFIIHIGANNLENAEKLLWVMKKCGMKRGGIQVLKEGKIMFEVTGTLHISCIAKKGKKMLFTKEYAKTLLAKANKKLEKNYKLLKKFQKECSKNLE